MKAIELKVLCVFLLLHLVQGNARYGTFGSAAYSSIPVPIPIPSPQFQGVPLLTTLNPNIIMRNNIPAFTQVSRGSERFSFDMIHAISEATQNYDANFVISPFSIWSLMVMVAEGASGQSLNQLIDTLQLPNDLNNLRAAYKSIQGLLLLNTTTIELAVNQALFSNLNHPVDNSYANILSYDYRADHLPINFRVPNDAAKAINDHISYRTQGKIQNVINPGDIDDTQLLLTSSIFFRGQWKFPFDVNKTIEQPFYRERGDYVAHVPMMSQENQFRFAPIQALDATFIELPYGTQNRLSMLLIYPNSTLATVFQRLRHFDIAKIHNEINQFDEDEIDDVKLTLPKFKIDSDLELRTLLEYLGVTDIFDKNKANLSKMSKHPLYVSRIFHKAIIEVNEVGTVAAALSAGNLPNRIIPREFVFNRPFGFLITDRITHTLLFAGQIRYPLV